MGSVGGWKLDLSNQPWLFVFAVGVRVAKEKGSNLLCNMSLRYWRDAQAHYSADSMEIHGAIRFEECEKVYGVRQRGSHHAMMVDPGIQS